MTERDRSLCFLPLSHAYERAWTFYILSKGAQNFYLDDPKRILEAMQEVRPTCMVSVPRLYEKIYSTARHRVSQGSPTKQKLFEWAVKVGNRYAHAKKRGGRVGPVLAAQHALADKLVLHKIRDIVGGPKNFFSAGGAALTAEIEEFFFAAGLLVCQGYGLTETSPMLTCNTPEGVPLRHGRQGDSRLRAEDRPRRRDSRARPERHARLLRQAEGDGRGLRGRLVQDRRHRGLRTPAIRGEGPFACSWFRCVFLTTIAARILRLEGKVGTLAPGAFADLLVVDGDPLTDLALTRGAGQAPFRHHEVRQIPQAPAALSRAER